MERNLGLVAGYQLCTAEVMVYIECMVFNTLTTAVLDQPPGRAANRLAPPRRLYKRVLNKAHLHLGDLLPDPLRVAHLRRSCELLRVVYEERLGARARPPCSVDGAVARARPRAPFARSAMRRMK